MIQIQSAIGGENALWISRVASYGTWRPAELGGISHRHMNNLRSNHLAVVSTAHRIPCSHNGVARIALRMVVFVNLAIGIDVV